MAKDTNIFGLMGHDAATRTAYLSFRGSSDVADWIADVDFLPAPYLPVVGFGQVHAGAALAVLAAPDIARIRLAGPPRTIEPRLTTFGGPRVVNRPPAASPPPGTPSCRAASRS